LLRRALKRPIIALAVSLGLVVSTATPAYAAWLDYQSGSRTGAWGQSDLSYYTSGSVQYGQEENEINKSIVGDGTDRYSCTEIWADQDLISHRPPSVQVRCPAGQSNSGVQNMHYVTSSGGIGASLVWYVLGSPSDFESSNMDIAICRVDVRVGGFGRSSSNCSQFGPGNGIDLATYNGLSYNGLWSMGSANEPERLMGDIEVLYQPRILQDEDLLTDINGIYHLVMQADGNLVVYNLSTQTACWNSGTQGTNNRVVMQADGNLVVYRDSDNQWLWQSDTDGTGADRLVMTTSGDLRVYNSSWVQKWHSNTSGCV
jgi:hypothetical protein